MNVAEEQVDLVPLIRDRQKALLQYLNEVEQRGSFLSCLLQRDDPVKIKHVEEISDHLHSILMCFSSDSKKQSNSSLQRCAVQLNHVASGMQERLRRVLRHPKLFPARRLPPIGSTAITDAVEEASLLSFLDVIKDPKELSPESAWELAGRAEIELTRQANATHLYILLKDQLMQDDSDNRQDDGGKNRGYRYFLKAHREDLEQLLNTYKNSQGKYQDDDTHLKKIREEMRGFLIRFQQARFDEYRRDRAKMRIRSKYLRFAGFFLSLSLFLFCALYIFADTELRSLTTVLLPLLAIASGATGSVLSRTYKLSKQPLLTGDSTNEGDDRPLGIRKLLADGKLFFAQLIIGATAGLVIFLVFSAGILPALDTTNPALCAVIGFLAGFSEPFFLGTLDRVAGQVSTSS